MFESGLSKTKNSQLVELHPVGYSHSLLAK